MRIAFVTLAAAALATAAGPAIAADSMMSSHAMKPAMAGGAMASGAMSSGAMSSGAMSSGAMKPHAGGMAADAMSMASGAKQMGAGMLTKGKLIRITITDLTDSQPFSPSYVESRTLDSAPLFKLGEKASDALVPVAEGGDIGMYSVLAAMNADSTIGDAELAIHTLPGQTRTLTVRVDAKHPLIDGVWMLGRTNDGFSGFSGIDGEKLRAPMTIEVRGYDAGSEKNNEKKGYMPALGFGNMRDPENGVITYHTGIRGDADAPKSWNWDVAKPVARITFTPLG
jgi:hypothetical protein